MHEVNALSEGLVIVEDRFAEIVRNEPIGGIRLLRQEGLIRDGAADIHAHADSVTVQQGGQLARVVNMRLLRDEPEAFVEVDYGHRDAEFLELPDGLLGLFFAVVVLLPGGVSADPAPEYRHAIPIPDDNQWLLTQPGWRRNARRTGSRMQHSGSTWKNNEHESEHRKWTILGQWFGSLHGGPRPPFFSVDKVYL